MTNKKGFTLIELLVVIAIIGILSAIGLVSLNGAREKARDAQRKSDVAQMNTALALYYDDNSSTYPNQVNGAAATKADCIKSGTTFVDLTVQVAYPAEVAQVGNPVWKSGGAMVTTYVSRALVPPGGGSGWNNVYCYDANEAAGTPRSSYVLFAGLEGAGGTTFFTVRNDGTSGTAIPAAACSAQATCP